MVEVTLSIVYLTVGLLVFYRSLQWFDVRNQDGDPEGLDALTSLGFATFWPVVVPIFMLYKLFRG